MTGRTPIENQAITACARIGKALQRQATADRQSDEAARALQVAQDEAVKALVATWPMFTAEQREQLRPILAGTIPGADGS